VIANADRRHRIPPARARLQPQGLLPPHRLQHPLKPSLAGQGELGGEAAGLDLSAFEVPEGMVVSSITLSPAVEREVEDEEAEEARRTSRSYPHGR
jgi:hypothetical protein